MPNYTPTQTVFALSMISNLGSNFKGTIAEIEAATYQAINTQLSGLTDEIGSWGVIWGPAVYQAPASDLADNVMVVFQAGAGSAVPGQLVVGIAGTNPYSAFDWLLEDFLVITAVAWAYGNPGTLSPNISLGTYLGLSILQALTPGPGLPGVGVTLQNFLPSVLAAPTPDHHRRPQPGRGVVSRCSPLVVGHESAVGYIRTLEFGLSSERGSDLGRP